jgi:hypothetical protein
MTNGMKRIPPLLTRCCGVSAPPFCFHLSTITPHLRSSRLHKHNRSTAAAHRRGHVSHKVQRANLMAQYVTMPSRDTILGGRLVRDGHPHCSCNTDTRASCIASICASSLRLSVFDEITQYQLDVYSTKVRLSPLPLLHITIRLWTPGSKQVID